MNTLRVFTRDELNSHIRHREGEKKLGESLFFAGTDWRDALAASSVSFVVIGIREDIGVRANHGRAGAASAVSPAFDSFLNQQDNGFIDASGICVLGEVHSDDLTAFAQKLDAHIPADLMELRKLVSLLDTRVAAVIREIVEMGKIPIVIGGGHNNAYGNIKGCSEALGRKINVINCDAHLDFRPAEGRHSGNGFSYAYKDGYIDRYAVLGIHEQYNSRNALSEFAAHPESLLFQTFESIFVREDKSFATALKECAGFVKNGSCGIEIDLDSITNVPSSAKTSSGLSAMEARQYIHYCGSRLNALYLHIAEGAPVLSHLKADNKTGKLIAYLMTDFIKAVSARRNAYPQD